MTKKKTARSRDAPEVEVEADESERIAHAFARLHVWQIQAVRDVLVVAAVLALFWLGYALRAVTVPLLIALMLAYLFEPLIERLCRHPKITRTGAIIILLGTVGVGVAAVLALTVPLVTTQTVQLIAEVRDEATWNRISQFEDAARKRLDGVLDRLSFGRDELEAGSDAPGPAAGQEADEVEDAPTPSAPLTEARAMELINARLAEERTALLAEARSGTSDQGPDWFGPAGRAARGGFAAVGKVIAVVVGIGLLSFLIPFYFFFFSLWYKDVLAFGRRLLPEKNRDRTLELLGKMDGVVAGFVRGRIVISVIMGLMLAFGWMLCGVPYAIVLGLIVGVFCAVPYLGGIGVPIAVAFLAFDQLGLDPPDRMGWLWVIVWPTLVFAVVQAIEGWALTPMIAGKATNLDPVTVLVAVLAGGSVAGVYGMLLAIPAAACGKILVAEVLLPHIRAWTRGEAADPLPIDRR